jgi:hypothetical protein
MQLFLNNQLADLSDDSLVALTFQINNLAEVKNQQGNTSNQFKLPLTQHNRQILGFPDAVAFTTDLPYTRYEARIIQDGMEIVPLGFAELNSVDDNTASITVLSGNVDFFDAIDGKLYDMGDSNTTWGATHPWKPYDHTFSMDNIVASQTKTEGWIWPMIDYGNLVYDGVQATSVGVNFLRPGFFLKTAIELITKTAGFTPTGSLLDDPLYNKLIVQFANDNFEHSTDQQNLYNYNSISISTDSPFSANKNNYAGTLMLNKVNPYPVHQNLYPNNPLQPPSYFALENCSVSVSFTYNVYIDSKEDEGHNGGVEIRLMTRHPQHGNSQLTAITSTLTGARVKSGGRYREELVNQKLTFEIDLVQAQVLYIDYNVNNSRNTTITIRAGATLSVTSKNEPMLYGQQVQCERIFPDIGQKDLLKDTLQRFGIICQTDSIRRVVNFASLRDIMANLPNARDWTSKCLDMGKSISFRLGSYAQINYLKYKEDDGIIPKTYGQSQIKIKDQTLPVTADLFESQFAPTLNRPFLGGSMAIIKKIDHDAGDNDFSISTQPRLLVDYKLDLRSIDKTLTLQDADGRHVVMNDTISVPYFYRDDGQFNLCWGDMPAAGNQSTLPGLKTTYYAELERILTETKKVVRWFLLTPRDILELDLLIPVYLQQDGAYYYINKIDSWRKGQATKVELVKLG